MNNNEELKFDAETGEILDAEPEITEESSLAVRPDAADMSLTGLANLSQKEAVAKVDTMIKVISNVRRAAIQMTHPQDWILYHSERDNRTMAYLQDSGCQRVRDIYGILIKPTGPMETIRGDSTDDFYCVIVGDGYSRLTKQYVYGVEGAKSSHEIKENPQFSKLTGARLEMQVRKHARANLDGNITRKLSGLSNVPIEALEEAGLDTSKCVKGRGFGKTTSEAVQEMTEIVCPQCKSAYMKHIPAGVNKQGRPYNEFWACQDRDCGYKTWENPRKAGE